MRKLRNFSTKVTEFLFIMNILTYKSTLFVLPNPITFVL